MPRICLMSAPADLPQAVLDFDPKPMPAAVGQPPESALGSRLQAVRNHYGLSADALSRLTKTYDYPEPRGVSATALLRYEAGEAMPAARELRLLCESLDVSADWLLFGRIRESAATVAGLAVLTALRDLHQELARARDVGEAVAAAPGSIAKMTRRQRIEEAKRRPV